VLNPVEEPIIILSAVDSEDSHCLVPTYVDSCSNRLRLVPRCTGLGPVARPARAIIDWMARVEIEETDTPVCPHLGLAADPRSHFTYPHPGHRCFVKDQPATTDATRQATFCLSSGFTACDRYPEPQLLARAGERPEPRRNAPEPAVAVFRIHVVRPGESLAGIAAEHGLTAGRVARANGLSLNGAVRNGARLVIPLGPASSSYGSDP
jgi:LysM repeat protein